MLDGVTLAGVLDLTDNYASDTSYMLIRDGLTLQNGTILIGGYDYGVLEFCGDQTLGGCGCVDFGALTDNTIQSNGVLTIGPHVTIQGQSGYIGYNANVATPASSSFINQGTISANVAAVSYDAIILQTTTPWTNDGVVEAANGGELIAPSLSTNYSAGTLTGGSWNVVGNSTMELDGQSITTNAANILLDGTYSALFGDSIGDFALANLSANAAGGSLTIQNGYTLTTGASSFTNTGAVTIASGALLKGSASGFEYDQTAGSTTLAGGELDPVVISLANTINILGGTLSGTGTLVGNVDIDDGGQFDPTGTVTIDGDYTQGPGGILNIDISGPNAGTDYPQSPCRGPRPSAAR